MVLFKNLFGKRACRHSWDVYADLTNLGHGFFHKRKTKICRKCNERRVKEKVW